MADRPEHITDKDIPEFARRCWQQYQEATQDVRKASVESLKMWLGGEHQWRPAEIAARRGANRPFISINRLRSSCALSHAPAPTRQSRDIARARGESEKGGMGREGGRERDKHAP